MTDEAVFLDAKGMKCPLPVLRARKAMQAVPAGGLLRVEATDPGADQDFVHFCSAAGHQLVETRRDGEVLSFLIRKGA